MTRYLILLTLLTSAARADFSYLMSRDGTAVPSGTTKYSYKGQKMAIQTGTHTIVLDFDAQTATGFDTSDRTYTVTKFSDIRPVNPGNEQVKVDVKETGAKKVINGFNASQLLITTTPSTSQKGMGASAEIEIWLSPDPPGASEARAFYQRNASKFPWSALTQNAPSQSMGAAMVEMYKKMTEMNGIPVQQIVHIKMAGGPAQNPANNPQNQARMEAARAQLEQMAKQGGQQGQAAQQALARMNAMSGGGASPGGTDITMVAGGHSTASISDSVFAVPAGYTQKK